jgi:predicted enzyme related to lactoylglutathione lyase
MLSTSFVAGSPNWADLGTPDPEASIAFYGGLFGWEPFSAGPEAGGYGFFLLDGAQVAAYGPLAEPGASPSWTVYFATADADATAKAAEQAGGTVRLAPFDVMTAGRMSRLTDPAGADFALWQPGDSPGLEAVNSPGSICWVELRSVDAAAARAFYETVLGWGHREVPIGPDASYWVSSTGGEEESFGGIMQSSGPAEPWLPYIEVADCDATVARAVSLGARVLHPAASAPGIGRMAALADPHGARFSVITSESSG